MTGPGAYEHVLPLGTSAPSYSMHGRVTPKLESFSPGPGAYDMASTVGGTGRAFTLSGRTGTTISSESPGPGKSGRSTRHSILTCCRRI